MKHGIHQTTNWQFNLHAVPLLNQPQFHGQLGVDDAAAGGSNNGVVPETSESNVVDVAPSNAADIDAHSAGVHPVKTVLRPVRARLVEVPWRKGET